MAKSLRLFRNAAIAESKEAALTALRAQLSASVNDGELIIVRYADGNDVKTIMGVTSTLSAGDGSGLKYTIFDSESVPSDVQDIITNIEGDITDIQGNITTIQEDIQNVRDEFAQGDESTYNSAVTYVTETIAGLDVADAAVAKSFVTEVSETDGKIAVKRGAVTSTGATVLITNGADGGINLEVDSAALVQYVGQDAIAVSAVDEGEKTISLSLNAADKVLTQSPDGLMANINLTWSNVDGLKLIGKGGAEIASIPAADFIKDAVLENVELKEATAEDPVDTATTGTFLIFTFNTDAGSKVINLDVTSLIDVYTGGNGITVTGKQIAINRDASSEAFFYVGATGAGVSGVTTAISSAVSPVQSEVDAIEAAIGLDSDGTLPDSVTASTLVEHVTNIYNELDQKIDESTAAQISVVAGNGISVTGESTEKTIAAVADPADAILEVTAAGIRVKDDAVYDCGTY